MIHMSSVRQFKHHLENITQNATAFQHSLESLIIGLLVLAIYLFTVNPETQPYAIYFYIIAFVLFGIVFLIELRKQKTISGSFRSKTFKILFFAATTGVLLLVANTGGFFSPFAYLLYLAGISLGFLFSPSLSLTFVLLIVGVLLPYVGTINAQLDLLSVFSLFILIPLSFFLRREYLHGIERQKKILILEEENYAFKSKVDEVLSNKVTRLAVELKEPLNDIAQIALYSKEHSAKDKEKDLRNIITASKTALTALSRFEETTTGKRLVTSKRK